MKVRWVGAQRKHFRASNMVDLGIDDNMIDGIERFGSGVRLTAEGRSRVFGGKICPNVRVGVIDDFDRTEALHPLNEETQVFPPR